MYNAEVAAAVVNALGDCTSLVVAFIADSTSSFAL
jgi:hypothetical protein